VARPETLGAVDDGCEGRGDDDLFYGRGALLDGLQNSGRSNDSGIKQVLF
jgi:hypothetical protein